MTKTMLGACNGEDQLPQESSIILGGTVWFNDITEASARDFAAIALKTAYEDPVRPLMVYIDSNGGEVDALNSILAVMDYVPNQIITVCTGKAMSAGCIILAHGDMRFASPNSRIMFHEISGGAGGNIADINTDTNELKRLNEMVLSQFAKDCGIKGGVKALQKKLTARDHYMTPEEAVSFGVVDQIGLPRLLRSNYWTLDIVKKPERSRGEVVSKKDTKSNGKRGK